MDSASRIGPADAEVVLLYKGGRDFRFARMNRGEEVPREFFYGYFDVVNAGIRAASLSTAGPVPGLLGTAADRVERAFAACTALGVRPFSARLEAASLAGAKILISYTDGFSLSMGLGFPRRAGRLPVLIGGFHGISDIEGRAPRALRPLVRTLISRSLKGLDHAFFFGPADREVAIERYGLPRAVSSVIPFGVDTSFWRPLPDEKVAEFVVAIGQDRNRDYDLLASAPGEHATLIVTRQKVAIPQGAAHVKVTTGDFFGSDSMTDEDLRRLYNRALAVIVPIRDVYQPSGYSVTLQAMSCGRPVILSRIKGLWAPELLRDGENCLLVPPGDAAALGSAIARIRTDPSLARRLGAAGRETALSHFGLDRIGQGSVDLARMGLDLSAARKAV